MNADYNIKDIREDVINNILLIDSINWQLINITVLMVFSQLLDLRIVLFYEIAC